MNETIEPEVVENQNELKNEIQVATATEIKVIDQKTYESANERIGLLQGLKKRVEDFFKPMKQKAQDAHKQICQQEKEQLSPILTAIDGLKQKTIAYYAAEQQRIAAEQERQRKAAEELAALAAEAETQGDTETATEAVGLAAVEDAKVTCSPSVKGTSMREVWRAEIIDADKVPRCFLIVDQAALDALAKSQKDKMNIPGVKAVMSYTNSTRAR